MICVLESDIIKPFYFSVPQIGSNLIFYGVQFYFISLYSFYMLASIS